MADTDTIWQGIDDDFTLAANWDNGIPGTTAADLLGVFDGAISQRSPQRNLDQSGATHAFKIATRRNFLAPIGSDGNPLVILPPASVACAWINGGGDVFLKVEGIAVGSNIIVDAGDANVQIDTESVPGADLGFLMVKSGRVTVKASATINTVTVNGLNAYVTVVAGGIANSPEIMLEYGTVVNAREFNFGKNEIVVRAGEFWQTGLLKSTQMVMTGGYFNYNPASSPAAFTPGPIFLLGTAHFDASDYAGSVPLGTVIKGINAKLTGSIIDQIVGPTDYNLADEYPGG